MVNFASGKAAGSAAGSGLALRGFGANGATSLVSAGSAASAMVRYCTIEIPIKRACASVVGLNVIVIIAILLFKNLLSQRRIQGT